MVASDRISTYDAVHPTPIPDKGRVLTGLSVLWFGLTRDIVPNHFISATDGVPAEWRGRALRVRRLKMLPVECIVRGYITGSGWKDYQSSGSVSGVALPEGLQESEQLPEPIYTPSTKAEEGHDEAIDFAETVRLLGSEELAAQVRDVSIAVYKAVAAHARERGVILADTKFEFGLDSDGVLTLGDEVCTPDSSRFWPADTYEVGPRAAVVRQAVRARLGDRRPAGTSCRPRRRSRTTSSRRPASATSPPTSGWPASPSARGWTAWREGARADPAQGRDPRPPGTGGRACPARARASRASPTCTSAGWSSSTCRTPRGFRRCASRLLANPLIEDYEIQ